MTKELTKPTPKTIKEISGMSCNRESAKGYKYTFRDMREES